MSGAGMPEGTGRMVFDDCPALRFICMMARAATVKVQGMSAEETALRKVEATIQQFWDLMLRHSKGPEEDGVAYKAYEGLHLRISKTLSVSFSTQKAMDVSRNDWKADSVQNTGKKGDKKGERTAIDEIKSKFRAASYKLGSSDWLKLFKEYDKDGNGELDADEFAIAVRKFVPKSVMSDKELKIFFKSVDEDGGGTIDAGEFEGFFFQGSLNKPQFFGSMWELAEAWAIADQDDDDDNAPAWSFDPTYVKWCCFLDLRCPSR